MSAEASTYEAVGVPAILIACVLGLIILALNS